MPSIFWAIALGILAAFAIPQTIALETTISPALARMPFVTFLQLPLAELGLAFRRGRFLSALLLTNFVVMPVITAMLVWWLPDDLMLRLAVLLTPCIDYAVYAPRTGRRIGSGAHGYPSLYCLCGGRAL